MKTAKLRDEKEVIDKKLNADVEAKKNLVENLQQLESRKDEISSQERELQTKLNKILHSIPKLENELTHLHEEHDKIAKERQSSGLVYTKFFGFFIWCSFKSLAQVFLHYQYVFNSEYTY